MSNESLTPFLSWRGCDGQRTHGDEHQRGLFLAAHWDRCLRYFRRLARDIHMRLESYSHPLHCHLHFHFQGVVSFLPFHLTNTKLNAFHCSGTSPAVGSVLELYDLLRQAGIDSPVVGNQDGSYLTMKSNQGLVFGAATILSGFAGVFCDQGELETPLPWKARLTERTQVTGRE